MIPNHHTMHSPSLAKALFAMVGDGGDVAFDIISF